MVKKTKKQPPPRRMTEQQRKSRAKRDSAVIQGTPLTKRQQRAQARKLAAKPRSDALEAMSDTHLSPPPDKLKAAAPVVTTIRRGVSGTWTAPAPHVQPEKVKTTPVNRDSAELSKLLDTLERSTTIRRAKHGKARSKAPTQAGAAARRSPSAAKTGARGGQAERGARPAQAPKASGRRRAPGKAGPAHDDPRRS